MKKNKKIIAFFIFFVLILQFFDVFYARYFSFASAKNVENNSLTSAKSMVTMESNSGRILYKKNENQRLPMASTTKIITAIVAIENCADIDEKYPIPASAVGIEGSSIYLRKNEHLSVRELLYGLMLRSGNDSAVAIAIIVAGSVENFVKMMNDFCINLGLKDTHLVTVNGLHDDNHYTSAYDLALITAYALKNETFAEIVSTSVKDISDENSKYKIRHLKNKNKLLKMVDGADGVKTGFTKKAGRCFVGSATRDNMQIVCVLLDCVPMFQDCKKLIEKGFDEYKMTKLFPSGKLIDLDLKFSKKTQNAPIFITKSIYYPLKHDEINKITASVVFKEDLAIPHNENDEIGEIQIRLKNDLIFSQKLFTINIGKIKEESPLKKIIRAF